MTSQNFKFDGTLLAYTKTTRIDITMILARDKTCAKVLIPHFDNYKPTPNKNGSSISRIWVFTLASYQTVKGYENAVVFLESWLRQIDKTIIGSTLPNLKPYPHLVWIKGDTHLLEYTDKTVAVVGRNADIFIMGISESYLKDLYFKVSHLKYNLGPGYVFPRKYLSEIKDLMNKML